MINSSTFLFTAVYGPFLRFSGRAAPLLGSRSRGSRSRYFRMTAPKERRRSRPVKPLAPPARQRINVAPFPERARAVNRRKNLYRHKLNTFSNCSTVVTRSRHSNHPTINVPPGFHPILGFENRTITPDFSTHPCAVRYSFVIGIVKTTFGVLFPVNWP